MALRLTTATAAAATVPSFSLSSPSHSKFSLLYTFRSISTVHWRSRTAGLLSPRTIRTTPVCAQVEESERKLVEEDDGETGWGKVSAVLFDMDGVLCNSEEPSRRAGVDVFAEMGVDVTVDDFVPFMGTGEANFLGGVAQAKGVKGFDTDVAKKRFFEIYLEKYAKPNSGIGFPGALELITQCKDKGLKVAVASSADRIKVDANLAAAGLPVELFDAIVSADAFENLKPAPDIFISASKILNVPQSECVVIEDALAGLQAANAAKMRCIVVTTTLSEETLATEAPSLIRKDIGNISLDDVISGGSSRYNEKLQASRFVNSLPQTGATFEGEANKTFSFLGLQASRRNIVKYGSLGVSLSCLFFAVSNRKAMQYASPKALWNSIFGVGSPSFDPNAGNSRSGRVQQFVNYISDLEKRGNALTVPEFPSRLDWLNSAPLQFRRDLKGKVVVLDFWTYCCINCMHVLPDLEFLEKKYNGMAFTVVGVHSAKFDNEKDSEAIRNAVLRYGITHPVVNDGDMYLWRELGVNSWPTFAVIGPTGRVIAQISGEGRRKDLDDIVEAALLFYGKRKMLDDTPLPLGLERDNDPRLLTSPLKFPGKLAVDTLNNRLFISDSNHNRIVVTDLDGNYITQVGSSGEDGLRDGNFDDATFNRPQGLAYNTKRNVLYVADTENHALREIDFVSDVVRTLAGNGTKGSDYRGGRKGMAQLLNSPWDVCFDPVNEKVYIAMAGQHQIWVHGVVNETTLAFSGDGSERNLNGSSATSTSYAQPSGMSFSSDMKEIYIADSESSSIRALDIKTGGSRLLAGGDPIFSDNLFKYGDHDGIGSEVLLQHPLGVCFAQDGQVYIADSYNHKIKKLDPSSKRVTSVVGNGKAGFMDGKALAAQLSEPSGLVQAGNGIFYIADTNNSVIRYMDLNHGEPDIRTLDLKGMQPPAPKARTMKRLRKRIASDTQIITVDGSQSAEGNLYLQISLPPGYHFSKEARSKFTVDTEPENAIMFEPLDGSLNPEGSATLHFRRETPSTSMGRINCKVYYCKEDEVCLYQSLAFEVPFKEGILESAPADFTLQYVVKPRDTRDSTQLPSSP